MTDVFVLTRTSRRPKYFARLQADLDQQRNTYAGRIHHIIHADDPRDEYPAGDAVIRGDREARTPTSTAPWERYYLTLLRHLHQVGADGIVTFIDDDDTYAQPDSIARMARYATPASMPIWRVERENGRISPAEWRSDLNSNDGRVCWEASAFHTSNLPLALAIGIDGNDGADGRFWAALARHLHVVWLDEVLTRPQDGRKGHGRRRDLPE